MTSEASMSFMVDESTAERLDRLVAMTDRPRSWHVDQALQSYLNRQLVQIEDIREGVAEADAGDFASDEEIETAYASFAEPLPHGP